MKPRPPLYRESADQTLAREAELRSRRWTLLLSILLAAGLALLFHEVARAGGWGAIFR